MKSSLGYCFLFCLFSLALQAQTNVVPDDVEFQALKSLWEGTNGANWTTKTNWPTADNWPASATAAQMDSWYGIVVTNGDISGVLLQSNNLTGVLPSSIGQLVALKDLLLFTNKLNGELPSSLGQLINLTRINLYGNLVTGPIPNMGLLVNLQELSLQSNSFTAGPVPSWIQNLPQLSILNLSSTYRTGAIPSFLGNLTELKSLYLHGNSLTGPIPEELGSLNKLVNLFLYTNQLTGSIPDSFIGLSSLQNLLIYNNQLTGSIPSWIGNLTNLVELNLGINLLNGTIPSSIGNLSNLTTLGLHSNGFTGSIPPSIGSIPNLAYILLQGNKLSGPIPSEIGNLTKLIQLFLHSNSLSGSIPESIGQCVQLTTLGLHTNKLSGNLPATLNNLTKIGILRVDGNQLSGPLPVLSNLTNIYQFYLDNNSFSGTLPDNFFATWTKLSILSIGTNSFEGPFPSSLSSAHTQLATVRADLNKFTSLPASLLTVPGLTTVNFNSNELTTIPSFSNYSNKANLALTLSNNRLDFSQLEPNVGSGIKTLTLTPLKNIAENPVRVLIEGGDLLLTARPKGANTSNLKWEKLQPNGTWLDITSSNADPVTGVAFRKANALLADEGSYRWSCTSTSVTGVTLSSDPIVVKTGERISLDNFGFQYKYDSKNRMIAKKVPGADWVYMVYDNRDRLVLTQDGEQRKLNNWSFTKYDALNRPIITGIYTHSTNVDQAAMASQISATLFAETFDGSAAFHGYTNVVFPTDLSKINVLTVNYYDNYNFKSGWASEFNYAPNLVASTTLHGVTYEQPANPFARVLGQLTGSKIKIVGTSRYYQWLRTVNYFDDKARLVQNIAENDHGGITVSTNLLDFTGKVLTTTTTMVGEYAQWTNLANVTVSDIQFKRASGASAWDAGAISQQKIPANANGWLEFGANQALYRSVGLSDVDGGLAPETVKYGIYTQGSGLWITDNGAIVAKGTYVVGDVFRIERVNGTISYKKNNVTFATSAVPSTTELIVDVSMSSTNNTFPGAKIGSFANVQKITRNLTYDQSGRLVDTWHQVNSNPAVLLARNEYNELGQLVDKKLYNTDPVQAPDNQRQFKQSVDYRYNIRGWVTNINTPTLSSNDPANEDADAPQGDFFGMQLAYNDDLGTGNASADPLLDLRQYNGNISAIAWKGYGAPNQRAYNYKYDAMNRLHAANYVVGSGTNWSNSSSAFNEAGLEYDLNGNINKLTRRGEGGALMDQLTYDYGQNTLQSNKLLSVKDDGDVRTGFIEKNPSGEDYAYDANGNMTIDRNKEITSITYNHLNLPEKVVKKTNEYVRYSYDATGRKLGQQVLSSTGVIQKTTEYVGEFVYENGEPAYLQHEEGRVLLQDRDYVYENDGASLDGLTATGTDLTLVTIDNNDYVVAAYTGSAQRSGIYPIGGTLPVVPGEKYLLRVRGYKVWVTDVVWQVRGNNGTTDLISTSTILAPDAASERWSEQMVVIPPGINDMQVGLVWVPVATNLSFYVNDIEIIKLTSTAPEYQFNLKDHLGNVRTTFTTKTEVEEVSATLEDDHYAADYANFLKYDDARRIYSAVFDHTNGTAPGYAQRLSGVPTEKLGLARSLAVLPGDRIHAEVYAMYFEATNTSQTLLVNWLAGFASGGVAAPSFVDGSTYSVGSSALPFASPLDKGSETGIVPKAYLNWAVFDKNFLPIAGKSGYRRITLDARQTLGQEGLHEKLETQQDLLIDQPGFVYIWLSNENETPMEVYFDDFKVTHTKSPVIQADDYYPFGFTFNSYNRENSTQNRYLYNQGAGEKKFNTERIADLGLNVDQSKYRTYDYLTGRWWQVDPKADHEGQESWSTYQFGFNNPIRNNDPEGDIVFAIPVYYAVVAVAAVVVAYQAKRTIDSTVDHFQKSSANSTSADKTAPPGTKDVGKKETGSYTDGFASGKLYHGKGDKARSQESGKRIEKETGDQHTSTDWTPANNDAEAFKQEDTRIQNDGGVDNPNNYNKINSPGRKLNQSGSSTNTNTQNQSNTNTKPSRPIKKEPDPPSGS